MFRGDMMKMRLSDRYDSHYANKSIYYSSSLSKSYVKLVWKKISPNSGLEILKKYEKARFQNIKRVFSFSI